jgi:hypothetical protein
MAWMKRLNESGKLPSFVAIAWPQHHRGVTNFETYRLPLLSELSKFGFGQDWEENYSEGYFFWRARKRWRY